ncbi:MAG: aminoglycoside phosphotransferase family protein [Candidatus Nanopelagicales bacterium]
MSAGLIPAQWLERISRLPADGGPSGAVWSAGANRLLTSLLAQFELEPAGPVLTGWTAAVLPVRRAEQLLALKLIWPNSESAGEPLALRLWGGNAAVRLVAADPGQGASLLELLDHTRDLNSVPDDEACEIIGGLLARLHIAAPPPIRTLTSLLDAQLPALAARTDLPRRMVTRVTGLAGELRTDPSVDATLLHTDLHYANVLAATREPWLAIDPKPMAGHPGFELQPLLRNRASELGSGAGFRWGIRNRLEIAAAAAGIDDELARAWTIVHTGIQCGWAAASGDAEGLSLHIRILKALEP